VYITILPGTADLSGFGWVFNINHDDTGSASVISRNSAHRVNHISSFIHDDVVGSTDWQFIEVTGEIFLVGENDGLGWVDGEELLIRLARANFSIEVSRSMYLCHVKDLNAMLVRFTSNDHIVLVTTDFTPNSRLRTSILW
jgi:hypothetical protein